MAKNNWLNFIALNFSEFYF